MAKKKEDFSNMPADQLEKRINEAREELMNLRFQQATGELTDFTRLSITRRQIARMLTIMGQRMREGE